MNPPSLLTVKIAARVRDLEGERHIAYVGMARGRVSLGLRCAAERRDGAREDQPPSGPETAS